MRTLTLDASMAVCSAGLVEDGTEVERREADDVSVLPSLVEQLFASHGSGVDRVAVTVGPGSFTGLRASIALAQGLALASGAALVGVTVGAALAGDDAQVWTVIDSKRGRVFLERDGAVESVALSELPLPPGPIRIGGDAAALAVAALRERGVTASLAASRPTPVEIDRAASVGPVRPGLPLYVEPPAARPGPAGRPAPV